MKGIRGSFTGFTFGGHHSSSLGITRVNKGTRYEDNLLPTLKEKTAEIAGAEGQIYWGTDYTHKEIPVSFVFQNLTDEEISKIKTLFNDKQLHELIFDENPYKVYIAKLIGTAVMKHICFENLETHERYYNGEGTFLFSSYLPYARSRYEYLEDYTVDNVLEWASDDDLAYIYHSGYTTIAVLPAKIEWDVDENGEVLGAIRGNQEDFEKWLTELNLLVQTEDTFSDNEGSMQTELAADEQYYNLLEWLQASRLPSREEYGNWSEGGYNLYNAGDVEIPFEIFFELSSTDPLTVTVQKGDRKVTLTAVNAKIKNTEIDKFIGINSRDYVVRGYNEDLKYTGNTYNEYITDGDFFLLEVGHNTLTTTVAPATVKMHYLYL